MSFLRWISKSDQEEKRYKNRSGNAQFERLYISLFLLKQSFWKEIFEDTLYFRVKCLTK